MNEENLANKPELLQEVVIENASEKDAEEIWEIQSQKIIVPEQVVEKEKFEHSGFLVYSLSTQELKQILSDKENHIIKVAKRGGNIVGYIISYDMIEWIKTHHDWFDRFKSQEEQKRFIQQNKVLYGRHIAIKNDINNIGISKNLLSSTFEEATAHGYKYYVVEVLKQPLENKASNKFVLKNGFNLIGQIEDENNRIWSVFLKDLTVRSA